jgi:DNA-binding transcriptional LysR family regulator
MELDGLRSLVALADAGSLSEAARQLGLARNTMRRRLEALETSIGSELFLRDTRTTLLTPVGRSLVAEGRTLLVEADRVFDRARHASKALSAPVHLILPVSAHPIASAMVWHHTRLRHPEVQQVLRFVEEPLAVLAHDGDFVVHFGDIPDVVEGTARRAGTFPVGLIASRAYIAEHGLPESIHDLRNHTLFCADLHGVPARHLPLRAGGCIEVDPSLQSNHAVVGWEAARMGQLIALVPNVRLPGDGWDPDDIVDVLPDLVGIDVPIWIVAHGKLTERPALQAVFEDIQAMLAMTGMKQSSP